MMGVVKLLDNAGRMRDQAPWFGSRRWLRFGSSDRNYTLMRAVLVMSDGAEYSIPLRPLEVERGEVPSISFDARWPA